MDKIEKIIIENRDRFEENLPNGHMERFKARMGPARDKKPLTVRLGRVAAVAAIVAITISVGMHLLPNLFKTGNSPVHLPPYMAETETYYVNNIDRGIIEIEKLLSKDISTKEEIEIIRHELAKMDSLYLMLQKDLEHNYEDERVVNAMIKHYQIKLDVINAVLHNLKNIKQDKKIATKNIDV